MTAADEPPGRRPQRESGPDVDELPPRLVEAASWRLAARMVAALPGSRVLQPHPGSGQYDVLAVRSDGVHAPAATFHINRGGGLRTLAAPHVSDVPLVAAEHLWPLMCTQGVETTVAHVLVRAGLTAHVRQRGRRWLTYEVLGHLLTSRALDDTVWCVHSVLLDTSGEDGGVRGPLLPDAADVWWLRPEETWVVTVDGRPVAWLWEGWLLRPNGERLDLAARYAQGATVADLAAEVARRTRPASQALPALRPRPVEPPEAGRDAARAWLRWAGAYDGYRLLARTPEALSAVLEPARNEYRSTGQVPSWCGPHLLRAWLFLLFREDHHSGGELFREDTGSTREWHDVVHALPAGAPVREPGPEPNSP